MISRSDAAPDVSLCSYIVKVLNPPTRPHKVFVGFLLCLCHLALCLREVPVVVNDPHSGQVVYLPPDAKDVPSLIDDLLAYIASHQSEVDPLILAGIFHKQFVLTHPFIDDNGRTTRLSTKILLAGMGLNTFNLFSFENYYNQNVTKYFQIVGEVGDYSDKAGSTDFTEWLEYFTEGIIDERLRVEKLLPQALTPETTLQPYHQIILEIIREKGVVCRNYFPHSDNNFSQYLII